MKNVSDMLCEDCLCKIEDAIDFALCDACRDKVSENLNYIPFRDYRHLRDKMAKATALLMEGEHHMSGVQALLEAALGWDQYIATADKDNPVVKEMLRYRAVAARWYDIEEARDRGLEQVTIEDMIEPEQGSQVGVDILGAKR